jgi:hypothetical protein
LANAFEKDGNLETAELLHDVFIMISKKKKKKSSGKNVPNNPSLWSQCKSQAKQKFDVYPSAYANGWAAKQYKAKGGTWRKASVNNTRLAQEIDTALDPKVRDEQNDIKDKQTLLSGAAAGDKLRNFISKENGDFQYLKTRADDFIQTLNVNPEVIEDLKNFAIYFIRLKINEPTLDESLYNDALNALINAKTYLKISEINTYNIYSINNYLRKKKLDQKVYFTALEMARLKSTGQAPGAQ